MATGANGHGSASPLHRKPLLELQRRQARYVAETGQIVLDAIGVLTKHQADALHELMQGMAGQGEIPNGATHGELIEEMGDRCLHLALHAFAMQVKLGLESAMTINDTALEILQCGLGPDRSAGSDLPAA